jgi:coxsackievirus/adenovirus receptor
MSQIKQDSTAARSNAQDAFNYAWDARNRSDKITKDLSDVTKRIWHTLDEEQATPAMVRDLASEVLEKNIQLEPDEITRLADHIKSIVGSLTDSEKILADTKDDLQLAHDLEMRAKQAKEMAVEKQILASKMILLLNDTQTAQRLAQSAIDKAETDVSKSQRDLADIADVTKAAQIQANTTTQSVEALDARLKQLQTQSVRNDFVLTKEIGVEAKKVADEAQAIDSKTKKLSEEYKKADESLNERVNKSKDDIQRTKMLLQRASELTADTSTKFKDLDGMEGVYRENERVLADLMNDIDGLTMEMERHLAEIEQKSQWYRQCSV